MMIIAIRDFYDKTTGKTKEEQELIKMGTLIECEEKLAKKRIEGNFAIEVLNPEILVPEVVEDETSKNN